MMTPQQSRDLMLQIRKSPALLQRPEVKQALTESLKTRPGETLALFGRHDLPMLTPYLEKAGIDRRTAREKLEGGMVRAPMKNDPAAAAKVKTLTMPADPFDAPRPSQDTSLDAKADDPFDAARPPVEDYVLDVMDDMLVNGPKPFGLIM